MIYCCKYCVLLDTMQFLLKNVYRYVIVTLSVVLFDTVIDVVLLLRSVF